MDGAFLLPDGGVPYGMTALGELFAAVGEERHYKPELFSEEITPSF